MPKKYIDDDLYKEEFECPVGTPSDWKLDWVEFNVSGKAYASLEEEVEKALTAYYPDESVDGTGHEAISVENLQNAFEAVKSTNPHLSERTLKSAFVSCLLKVSQRKMAKANEILMEATESIFSRREL